MENYLLQLLDLLRQSRLDFDRALETPFALSENDWKQLHATNIGGRHQGRIVPLLSLLTDEGVVMADWESPDGTFEDEVRSYMNWASHLRLEILKQQDALILSV